MIQDIPDLVHVFYKTYQFKEFSFDFMLLPLQGWKSRVSDCTFVQGPNGNAMAPSHEGKVYWGPRGLACTSEEVRQYIEAIIEKDWKRCHPWIGQSSEV